MVGRLLPRMLAGAVLGLWSVGSASQVAVPMPSFEARAMWVATVANIDWPTASNKTPVQQRTEAIQLLDLAVSLKFNIVVLQVRTQADAFYPSPFDPWSPYLTGTMGTAPSDGYDPLQFWVSEARKRGIELHAWINPYRALVNSSTTVSSKHISSTHPQVVKTYGDYKWMDPGHPFSADRTLSVVADLVTRYDLDGIHIDDYFYPYPIQNTAFPDDDTYAAYQSGGGTLGRSDWRRDNVNQFVQRMYTTVKLRKPWVKVGISPFGIWRPGYPAGVTGLDAYASLYADSRKWLNQGWLDYVSPQLYWKLESTGQPYEKLLAWWVGENKVKRHVWPGNYTSNVNASLGDWPVEEITNQIESTRRLRGATGNVHFSARAIRGNWKGVADRLRDSYRSLALVPPSPWLDAKPPEAPSFLARNRDVGNVTLQWSVGNADGVARFVLSTQTGLKWSHRMLDGATRSVVLPEAGLTAVGLRAIDRAGNVSAPAILIPSRR